MTRDFEAYKKSTYQWHPGHEKHLRITKSSLTSDFDFCPKQYEFTRIQGRKTPETDAMRKGTNIHNAMEEFYVLVRPVIDKALAFLNQNKRGEAFKLFWNSVPKPDEENPWELGEKQVLLKRINWELDRLEQTQGERFLPVINEDEVHVFTERTIEFNGEEVTIPIHFAGMIDRGFENDDGTYSLMELKTGKWKQRWKQEKNDWVNDSFKVKSMRTEMAFYVKLLEMADHPMKNVTHWGWFYPDGSCGEDSENIRFVDHWDHEKVKKANMKTVDRMVNNLLEAYLMDHFPPDPHVKKCVWCPFDKECSVWAPNGAGEFL